MALTHSWELSPKEAKALQSELAESIVLQPIPGDFHILGAADIGYVSPTNQLAAVMVTFQWPQLEAMETSQIVSSIRFPYIPGLLSFREVPALLEAYGRLERPPDVLLCDGQGLAHPRRFGLASHLGLLLGIPTVGCAKKRLCGEHAPLPLRRGASTPLVFDGEAVGCVLRSREGVKPIYISPGHLSDLETSTELIQRCLGRYRLPEPLRRAHAVATMLRRKLASGNSLA